MIKIVMMGTGPFAVPTLETLVQHKHNVVALVTRPVPPASKRTVLAENPTRDAARTLGLPIFEIANVNEQPSGWLGPLQPDLLVVCDFGQILSNECLSLVPLGGINLHGSLLPKYRGAAPIQWAMINGEPETGVSVIHMTGRLDAGPILVQQSLEIGTDEEAPQLEQRLAKLGAHAVLEAIAMLEGWDRQSTIGTPQDHLQATKAPRLSKEHGAVDFNDSAERIRNQVRALKPWPTTYALIAKPITAQKSGSAAAAPLRLIFENVSVISCGEWAGSTDPETAAADYKPGTILRDSQGRMIITTGKDCLLVNQLRPAGKRAMSGQEFLRGHADLVGATFLPRP